MIFVTFTNRMSYDFTGCMDVKFKHEKRGVDIKVSLMLFVVICIR